MATKAQAKAAVDNAATQIKSDIDNILPAVGNGIVDGVISFGPIKYSILLDAEGNIATANSWSLSIRNNLTTALRNFEVTNLRRASGDPRNIEIKEIPGPAVFVIRGF